MRPRAPKVCAVPSCPNLTTTTHCEQHTPKPWSGSTRRKRLPSDWPHRRRITLRKARGLCQKCGAVATEVDHVEPGDNHNLTNLQALCKPCHAEKTQAEATEGRRRSA